MIVGDSTEGQVRAVSAMNSRMAVSTFLRLLQLEEVCRFGKEVVVNSQHIAKIKCWEIGVGQGGVRSDDFCGAKELTEIYRHGEDTGVFYDLRFMVARATKLIAVRIGTCTQGCLRHKVIHPRDSALEDRSGTGGGPKTTLGLESARCAGEPWRPRV